VGTLQIMQQVVDVRTGNAPNFRGPRANDTRDPAVIANAAALQRADADSLRTTGDRLYPRQREQEAARDRIEELNNRVIGVLAAISDSDPTPDPRHWWQWWYSYTDAPPAGKKPEVVVADETEYGVTPFLPVAPISSSCFGAGTPVWTETGAVPIESIKIGDRV